jgi:ABC-type sugar transport system ATPase subunit
MEYKMTDANNTPQVGTPILECRRISKAFGAVQAVKQVNWQVFPGEVTALVGDNGAGKSTLIKLIAGAYARDEGDMFVKGQVANINSPQDAFKYGIATIYQDLALVEPRDVVMNMFLGIELTHGPFKMFLDHRRMQSEAERILRDEVHSRIPSVRRLVYQLSGGQRQAVAVGRALLRGGEIIIMDEPTAALGVEQTQEVLRLIDTLRSRGKTVILISHNLAQIFEIADQISVMYHGEMVGTRRVKETTREEIVSMIVGVKVDDALAVA